MLIDRYHQAVEALLKTVRETQRENIFKAGELVANAVENGGKGGDVIFVADSNLSTLVDFRYKRKYAAQAGANGQGRNMSGKRGENLIIQVPRGTVVRDAETNAIIVDMSTGEDFVPATYSLRNLIFANPTTFPENSATATKSFSESRSCSKSSRSSSSFPPQTSGKEASEASA